MYNTSGDPTSGQGPGDMALISGRYKIIIGKQRNGPIGKARLKFTGNLTKFEDLAHEMYNDFVQ